ncbi:MAG: Asr1405/Asl0597 family protein [Elainellaceae cyanobacterium]
MDDLFDLDSPAHVVSVCRSDRWRVYHRLRELDIPCTCPRDGSLRISIDHPLAIAQLRSVIAHTTASRQQLVTLLERCLLNST